MNNFINTAFAHTLESGWADLSTTQHNFGMMGGFGWTGIFFGWTLMVLFWALVALAIIALVKYISRGGYEKDNYNIHNISDIKKDEKTYVCGECGYEYREKEWAIKCKNLSYRIAKPLYLLNVFAQIDLKFLHLVIQDNKIKDDFTSQR